MKLTPKARQQLKMRAHALKPVVMLGNQGFTEAVKKEIDRALVDHELIKIRITTEDRDVKKALFDEICESMGAAPVQLIGKIGVIFRKN